MPSVNWSSGIFSVFIIFSRRSFFQRYFFNGIILKLCFEDINFNNDHATVSVGSSINWHQLVLETIKRNIYGFENLSSIPGSVGAAPIQNIGAYGQEVSNLIRSIKITDGGSGYSQSAPPNATITAPAGPEAILAELSANVSAAGTITSVDVIASGRNFLPTGVGANQQDVTISFSSGNATAVAEMDPIFFTVETATEPTNAGLTTVTFNEFIPYAVSAGSSSEFKRISRIITSSHSFEYIGACLLYTSDAADEEDV